MLLKLCGKKQPKRLMPHADNNILHNVDINSFIWPEMLIGQISIIGHNSVQCFAFYVIMSALNKTERKREMQLQRHGNRVQSWADAIFCAGWSVKLKAPEWYFDLLMRPCGPGVWGSDELTGATDSAARWIPSLCLLTQITSHNVTFPSFSQTPV